MKRGVVFTAMGTLIILLLEGMPSVTLLEFSWLETECLQNKTVSYATQIFPTRHVSTDFSMLFSLFGPTVHVHSNFSDPIRPVAISSDLARHVDHLTRIFGAGGLTRPTLL